MLFNASDAIALLKKKINLLLTYIDLRKYILQLMFILAVYFIFKWIVYAADVEFKLSVKLLKNQSLVITTYLIYFSLNLLI